MNVPKNIFQGPNVGVVSDTNAHGNESFRLFDKSGAEIRIAYRNGAFRIQLHGGMMELGQHQSAPAIVFSSKRGYGLEQKGGGL